ncbi:MAG: methyltransferase domain-containing protein, partial [Candidatus Omnitrophica bacterium]|nr:methyltransferase domain-containing protein [Candidatus Omnitrophota bacterium]
MRAKERGKPVVKKEWSEFYAEPAGVSGFLENIIVHREFLEEIVKSGPRDVLEVGCGSGTLSVFLSHLGCRVTAVDKDERIIKKAKQASDTLNGRVSFR